MKHYKTPSFVQFEATECGAVALYIILGYYGKWVPLEDIRVLCKVGRDGANLANTAKAAEYYDLEVDLFSLRSDELEAEFEHPCIIFWNRNHFLVVEGFSRDFVFLSDPARGRRKVTKNEFNKSFSSYTIFLKPSEKFVRSGNPPSLLKRILKLIGKQNASGVTLTLWLGLLTTIPTLGISAISTYFTESVLSRVNDANNGYVWILLLLTFLTMLSMELMSIINRRLQSSINEGTLDSFFKKIFTLPVAYYSQRDLGELSNRVTISSKLSNSLTGPIANASVGITQIIVYSIALLFFSPWLTLLLILIATVQIYATITYLAEIDDLAKRSSISNGRMSSALLYMTSNSEQVKGNGLESQLFDQWSSSFSEYTNASSKTSLISQYASSGTSFLNNISDYLVIGVGGGLILTGKMSIADFVGMRIITQGIFAPLGTATSVVTAIKSLNGDVGRLFDVYDNATDPMCIELDNDIESFTMKPGINQQILSGNETSNELNLATKIDPTLSLKDVSYSFQKDSKPVLKNFSITFEAGSITAICGPSGCGKSTLLRIIAGLITPTDGKVIVGKDDMSKISKQELLDSMAYVDTEIFIMHDTVANNVTLLDPTYSHEEVITALKKACIFKDIAKYPSGIEYVLQADGDDLSGGQKQRIQLARAFLREPLITIIDEGTSALDNETEKNVISELVKTSTTVIVTTHRSGFLSIADQILFINSDGTPGGIGTFDELSRTCQEFHSMFK